MTSTEPVETDRVFNSTTPRGQAGFAVFVAIAFLGFPVWTAINNWPPSIYLVAAVAFDVVILWNLLATPALSVRITDHRIKFRSFRDTQEVETAQIVAVKPDLIGRPLVIHGDGKIPLQLHGDQLQSFLVELRRANPAVQISGLAAS